MAHYKKVIYETGLVGNPNSDAFHCNVNKYLTDWQDQGYEVDIQFAANNSQVLAFMIKYKMELVV